MDESESPKAAGAEKIGLGTVLFGGAAVFAVLIANVGVLARYVFQYSIPSVEEILRFLFVWLIFVCSALSFREGNLISITMLGDILKRRPLLHKALAAFQNLAVLAFSLVILQTGWKMIATQFEFEELSVVMEINMGWMTLGALVGCLFLVWFSLVNLFRLVKPGKR